MRKNDTATNRIHLYLPEKVVTALYEQAEKEDRPVSNIAKHIFEQYFKMGKKPA